MQAGNATNALLDREAGIYLGTSGDRAAAILWIAGAGSLGAAVWIGRSTDQMSRFFHSYLVAFAWVLSVGLGAVWWVTLQHLVSARWSVAVRRVGELMAANMPLLGILALPVVVPVLLGDSTLFPWVDVAAMRADDVLSHKMPYLNATFFAARCVVYFGFWSFWSFYLLNRSRDQDSGGKEKLAERLRSVSAPAMIGLAITITFAAFDFLMSLDPMWFSTIFGVYFFAGGVVAWHGVLALSLQWLQGKGRLRQLVTTEHYHDIGKMLFAFTIFWAYIGFSQFMLIWYGNLPEETTFFIERMHGSWMTVNVLLIVGHFLVPFLGLLSRHAKRARKVLAFWAIWMLVMHYVDMYWLVMPNLDHDGVRLSAMDLLCLAGLGSLVAAATLRRARVGALIPTHDPKLADSLAFENM